MSNLSNKCVLLKGLPCHLLQKDIENFLQGRDGFSGVDKIQDHTEKNKKQWIILFKTEEEATKCFNSGPWQVEIGSETVTAFPDYCSDSIIPDEWVKAFKKDQSWVLLETEDDRFSSVSSSELYAGSSLPFQPTGEEEMIQTAEVYRNNLDENGISTDVAISTSDIARGNVSPIEYSSISSESDLFGSGYKNRGKKSGSDVNMDTELKERDEEEKEKPEKEKPDNEDKQERICTITDQVYKPPLGPTNSETVALNQDKMTAQSVGTYIASQSAFKPPEVSNYSGVPSNAGQQFCQNPMYTGASPYIFVQGFGPMPVVAPNQFPYYMQGPAPVSTVSEDQNEDTAVNRLQPICPTQQPISPTRVPTISSQQPFVLPQHPILPTPQMYQHQMYFYPPVAQQMYIQDDCTGQVPHHQPQKVANQSERVYYLQDGDSDYLTPVAIQKAESDPKPVKEISHQDDISGEDKRRRKEEAQRRLDTVTFKDSPPIPAPRKKASNSSSDENKVKLQQPLSQEKVKTQSSEKRNDMGVTFVIKSAMKQTNEPETVEEPVYDEIPADLPSLKAEEYRKPSPLPTEKEFPAIQRRKLPSLSNEEKKPILDQRPQITLSGCEDSSSRNSKEDRDEKLESHENKTEGTNKIIVTGFKETASTENLEYFFENNRKSGGGEIISIEKKTDPDAVVIEFKDGSVVTSVLQKQADKRFELEGAALTVKEYTPPPVDAYKVFITGLKEGVSLENLEMLLEIIITMAPENVEYGETPGTALLTFEKPIDFDKLEQGLKRRTLEDKILSASKVDVSSCVKITGYGGNTSEETLMFYFENKRSGGGEVTYIKMEEDRALVHFNSVEDAERVCDGRKHHLENKELSVSLYYKCLDFDRSFQVQIPKALHVSNLDSNILKFIKTSKYKDELEVNLQQNFAVPVWPASEKEFLQIHCTLDPKRKESVQLVREWAYNCTAVVSRLTDILDANEDLRVQPEIWDKANEALVSVDVEDPDDVAVFMRKEEKKVVICGVKKAVVELSDRISCMLEQLEKQEMEDSRRMEKKIVLQMFEIALLNSVKFFEQKNFSASCVTFEVIGREITFRGQKVKVDQVISTMYEQLKIFVWKSFPANKTYQDLLLEKEVRDYIKTQMMKQKVLGVWNIKKGENQVYMYSKSEKQAQTAIDIVGKCLIQKTIPLDLKMEAMIDEDNGKNMMTKLTENHQGLLKLEKTMGELLLVTVDYLIDKVHMEISEFLDLNVSREEFVDVESGKLCFINKHWYKELEHIADQYKKLSVAIKEQETFHRHGFKVKGKKDGCRLAIKQLQALVEKVVCDDHSILKTDIDVKQVFEGTQGRNELLGIEMRETCIIKIKPEKEKNPTAARHSFKTTRAECIANNCKITVVEGDLTELHDKADVLVIPRNIYLANTEGLAGAIVQKGGYDIQKECEACMKKQNLSYCDVVVGKAGSLECKHIFHLISPEWRGGMNNEENLLRDAIKNCFDKMSEKKVTSIAFPAVGTGRFGFSKDKALSNIISAIKSRLKDKQFSFVTGIYLCDLKEDVVTGFIRTLSERFKDVTEIEREEPYNRRSESGRGTPRPGSSVGMSPVPERKRSERGSKSSELDGRIKISVVKDELAKQKVDVIVNSTNTSLDLKVGTISKSLLRTGGNALMQDLQQKYPDGIKVGEVATSVGGNLHCKEVYHGVLVKWDRGQGISETVMKTFVSRCLELADSRGMTTIAFPALGTGVLGFPADRVAHLMFETVMDYENDNPATGIRDILLIVYQDDTPTVQAFTFVEEQIRAGHIVKRESGQRYSFARTFRMTNSDLNTSYQYLIGPVTVSIVQGDITKEKTDIVVNSTTEDLNFISGAVSKAILTAAGSSLQLECQLPDNREQMRVKGLIVTGSGNMMCGRILHVKARSKSSSWEETVKQCLKTVEDKGASSVSFPALGTGGKGCNPDSVAKAMFSAFKQYIQSAEYKSTLKSIRIVIFQSEMVKLFISASEGESKGAKNLLAKFRHKPKESKISFRIYADSTYKTERVKDQIDNVFVEETLYPRKHVLDSLKDRQVDIIERIAKDKNLGIHVSSHSGSIKIIGAKFSMAKVKDEIMAYLNNIEKDMADRKAAAAAAKIPLPKSWGRMGLTDTTQVINLTATVPDYIATFARFQREALGAFTSIVKIERIQNPTLYTQYMAKKKQMEQANASGNVERVLWHGTSGQVADNICKKGFDRNYNAGASHGVGVYFAVKAATSVQGYCRQDAIGQRHVFLAKVLTGDYCVGQGAIRVPPKKPSGNPHDTYDSTTDNMAAPNFFVIFHDAQAYPEFLITFR